MGVCDKRMEVGDIVGVLCSCGHVNLVHDAGGCAMCALRVIAPAVADPPAPTLREQVYRTITEAWRPRLRDRSTALPPDAAADAVLAVVADWLAAQPLHAGALPSLDRCEYQRDRDVALIRDGGPS